MFAKSMFFRFPKKKITLPQRAIIMNSEEETPFRNADEETKAKEKLKN